MISTHVSLEVAFHLFPFRHDLSRDIGRDCMTYSISTAHVFNKAHSQEMVALATPLHGTYVFHATSCRCVCLYICSVNTCVWVCGCVWGGRTRSVLYM